MAECAVAWWYRLRGYRVVARRFRTARGEIDLVLVRGRSIVFVEVKARRHFQDACEAVSEEAVFRISAAAEIYLARHPHCAEYGIRFDLICFLPDFRLRRLKFAF